MNQEPAFKPTFKATKGQIFFAVLIMLIILSIPFLYSYFRNPNRTSVGEFMNRPISQIIKIKHEEGPTYIEIPVVKKQVDVSVIKENPMLLVYFGIFMFIVAVIIGITLMRNL